LPEFPKEIHIDEHVEMVNADERRTRSGGQDAMDEDDEQEGGAGPQVQCANHPFPQTDQGQTSIPSSQTLEYLPAGKTSLAVTVLANTPPTGKQRPVLSSKTTSSGVSAVSVTISASAREIVGEYRRWALGGRA
ncbi:hypothetical protein P7C70_g9500, partial [Phenoliferia sp. Uapishka_3]